MMRNALMNVFLARDTQLKSRITIFPTNTTYERSTTSQKALKVLVRGFGGRPFFKRVSPKKPALPHAKSSLYKFAQTALFLLD